MVSRCMKEDEPFGVTLLLDGPEADSATSFQTAGIGTLAKICDWDQGDDGLLGVLAMGTEQNGL